MIRTCLCDTLQQGTAKRNQRNSPLLGDVEASLNPTASVEHHKIYPRSVDEEGSIMIRGAKLRANPRS
jgi:hypothetical protein